MPSAKTALTTIGLTALGVILGGYLLKTFEDVEFIDVARNGLSKGL